MPTPRTPARSAFRRLARGAAASALAALLVACGGGDDGGGSASTDCSPGAQRSWLADWLDREYLWAANRPHPAASGFATIESLFYASLLQPTVLPQPAGGDVWSYVEPTASYDQFFGAGKTLGYGLMVAGREVACQSAQPLRVRYVEPGSPADDQGLLRGQTIVSIDGKTAAQVIDQDCATHDGYAALTPAAAGDRLSLVVRDANGTEFPVELVARTYALAPVPDHGVVFSPAGKPVGWIVVKDFIDQASPPIAAAFAEFKAQGVREVAIDLRYNGGGLISVADGLASHAVGPQDVGQVFARLQHSEPNRSRDSSFVFTAQAAAIDATRVYVLTGPRSCSASELVVNGLKPFVDVVQIGGTTCGKPVGFEPVDHCGNTFSAVTFAAVNANGEGNYYDGLAPKCAVADDFDHPLGDKNEGLLTAARGYADTGACPASATSGGATAATREQPMSLRPAAPRRVDDGGRRGGMVAR